MKTLKLLIWLLAPLAMFALAYLFLLPPESAPIAVVRSLAVVIVDPVALEALDENAALCPNLLSLQNGGLTGTIISNDAMTMDDATMEILTGKSVRQLNKGRVQIDPDTYQTTILSPDELAVVDLKSILKDQRITVAEMMITADGADMAVERFPGGDGRSVTVVRMINDAVTIQEYIQRLDALIVRLSDEVDTWMIISPMTEQVISRRFCVNNWLREQGYLTVKDDGNIDFETTRVFYAGGHEPGLRINRQFTYASGTVSRSQFDTFRTDVADAMRQITPSRPLFARLVEGESAYPYRLEGHYPDIVWQLTDPTIEILPDLSMDGTSWCDGSSDSPETIPVAGGWLMMYGDVFDHQLRDLSRIKTLLPADITPTVLYMLHLPVAKDMDGRVLRPAMTAEQHRRIPETLESYSVVDPLVEQHF